MKARTLLAGAVLTGGAGTLVILSALTMSMAGMSGESSGASTAVQPVTCQAPLPAGAPVKSLSKEQVANARAIIETGVRLKVPERGLVVSIATALQESTLRNLSYGDRDSVGLFQQRGAWGSFAERTDPVASARMFFTGGHQGQRGLIDVPGWQSLSITAAAQAVQISGYPLAYAKWESLARTVVASMATPPIPCETPDPPSGPAQGLCISHGNLTRYGNGRIPTSALCPLPFAAGHRLRADAANAAIALSAAYKAHFGGPLCVTDSYRTLAEQYDVFRRKPGLAARPGTSNHGWGVALDLCGGIQTHGSPQDVWMRQNEGRFGWELPSWAQPNGSKPENWHREYTG